MLGGIPLELDYLMELDNFAKENDAFIHTDGARLINAAISLNIPLDEICQYTDTVRDQLFCKIFRVVHVNTATSKFIRLIQSVFNLLRNSIY